jgi:putative ABC transport system substrate-binding protein
MRKLPIIVMCLVLLPAWSPAAGEAGVAAVFSADISPYRQAFDGFRETVQEKRGAVRTVEHDLGKEEEKRIVQRIRGEKPRLVFTIGPEAARFAREKLQNLPVVYSMVLRPQPLAGPNITWVSLDIPVRIRLEGVRRMLPKARRVGVIYSPESAALYRELARECAALGLRAVGRQIDSGQKLPDVFADLVPQIDLFFMLPDTGVFSPRSIEYLLVQGLKNRVPVIGLSASYSRAGALMSFEADYRDVGRQAGEMALRILAGENPAAIEPAPPRRIKTSVNLAVAERLGLRLDPEAVKEASEIFK